MRGSLQRLVLIFAILCYQLSFAQSDLDSIQRLVDSDLPSEKFAGFVGLAEYHSATNDSLAMFILSKANLEEADLGDSLYRDLMMRKAALIKRLYDHDECLNALNRALTYSKSRNDTRSLAKWNELKASHYFYIYQYDSCQQTLDEAIKLLEAKGLEEEKGNLILRAAGVQHAIGNYEKAITRAFEATEIFKRSNQEKQLGVAYLQLGNIHYFLKSFNEAQTYYDLSAVHFKKTGDINGYNKAISNLGLIHIEKKNFTKGIQLQHMALQYFHEEKKTIEAGNSYYYLGKAFNGLHDYDSSDHYLKKSIKTNRDSDYEVGIAYGYWIMADNHSGRSQLDSALYYNDAALRIIEKDVDHELEKKLQEQRSIILQKKGRHKAALNALQRSIILEDSLNIDYEMLDRLASNQRAKLESAEYELKVALEESELVAEENKKQQQLIVTISIIAFLLVFFVIGLVLTNKRNKSLHIQLLENKDTIEHELDNNKALLKEIHHRVKNNLQIISSMLSIQSQYIDNEKLNEIISECRSRIVSMSLIHESLYKKEDDERSLFSNYIKELIPRLIETYHVDKSKVDLKMRIEDFELSLDDSVPCGLMINEIVSNSLKHAFPYESNGMIEIDMHKAGKEMVLKISDDGVGLKEAIDPEAQDTFGFLLIYTLAHQLEAKINVHNNGGVAFDIRWQTKSDKLLS